MTMPQLFLQLPPQESARSSEDLCAALAAFCARVDVAALLLPQQMADAAIDALAATARRFDTMVLLADDVVRCRALRLDGLHLVSATAAAIRSARRALGEGAAIGACCPQRRHEAMELGEAGADYVMIDQHVQARGENLLSWWAEMCTVPVVAARPAMPEELAALARMGADFVVAMPQLWNGEQAADALGRRWRQALAAIAHDDETPAP